MGKVFISGKGVVGKVFISGKGVVGKGLLVVRGFRCLLVVGLG